MIEVSISAIPFGQRHNAKAIATMTITNEGGSSMFANYSVRWDVDILPTKYAEIKDYDRSMPVENLIAAAFAAIQGDGSLGNKRSKQKQDQHNG